MASSGEPRPAIVTRDLAGVTTVRTADIGGPAAANDPRLREQFELLSGQRLTHYTISIFGVVWLSFESENAATAARTIQMEQETIELTQAGQQPRQVPGRSEVVAVALVNTLDHRLSRAEINDGWLRVAFDNGVHLAVAPHQQWEAWQINSEDGLLIVCVPGGELAIWYPDRSR